MVAVVWPLLLALASVGVGFGDASAQPTPTAPEADGDTIELVVFHGEGCPHCARELTFLGELQARWPELRIATYEVWNDEANRPLLISRAAEHGFEPTGVPVTFLAENYWLGFSDEIAAEIEEVVAALHSGRTVEPSVRTHVGVPGVGSVDVGDRSMLIATLLIGFADGLNPCSLWALSILLALVLHSGSRRRVMAVGSVFLFVTSALYGLYMVGAYSALDYASELTWIRSIVAAVAGVFGLMHLRSFLTDQRSSLSISEDHKPELYRRMRALADPDRSALAVLGGTVVLATGISLLETPCTAGLPLLWTDMLADRDVSRGGAVLLFAVYLGVFLLDELALFFAAVWTLRATKLQENHGRALHLVGGSLMTTLAAVMIAAPEALETVAGTLGVLAMAAAVATILTLLRAMGTRSDQSPRNPTRTRM